jgi:hypothetical protein
VEQNKALMRKYVEEAWNKGDLDFIGKNFSADFVIMLRDFSWDLELAFKEHLSSIRDED